MTVRLFDISHWNATADFAAAKRAGFVGVYLKATDWSQGKPWTDKVYAPRVKAARAAGLHVGAYLFFHPDVNVNDQVDHFASVVDAAGGIDLLASLDHETAPAGMSSPAIAHAALLAATALRGHFAAPTLVYMDRAFISEGKGAGLETLPLWIADYRTGATTPDLRGRTSWALWQTGQAVVPGVAGGDGPATDVNRAPALEPLLRSWYQPVPSPGPVIASPLLHKGDVGPKVTDVQHALDLCDPRNLTAHNDGLGHFGARTLDVLQTFQRNRHLHVTGTTTPETWAALRVVAHRRSL